MQRAETLDIHAPNVMVGDPLYVDNRLTGKYFSVNRSMMFASVIEAENDK